MAGFGHNDHHARGGRGTRIGALNDHDSRMEGTVIAVIRPHLLALPLAAAALALATAPAGAAVELGAATYNGGLAYYPTLGTACVPTTMDVEGGVPENPAVMAGTGASPYAGWFSFDGKGQSACESLLGGSGSLQIWGNGGFASTDLQCGSLTSSLPPLSGSYTREGAAFAATLTGSCVVDYTQTVPVSAVIAGTWTWELNHAALVGTITFTELPQP